MTYPCGQRSRPTTSSATAAIASCQARSNATPAHVTVPSCATVACSARYPPQNTTPAHPAALRCATVAGHRLCRGFHGHIRPRRIRISTIDAVINALDTARIDAGLSKAALARAINAEPATIRRMFSSARGNPTLGTLAGVAAALGLRLALEPLSTSERKAITEPLRQGQTGNAHELIAAAEIRRQLTTT